MRNLLADGSVIPSYLNPHSTEINKPNDFFGNVALREGIVQSVLYPDPAKGRKYLRYRVWVTERDGAGAAAGNEWICRVAVLFGGRADKFKYTLRPAARSSDEQALREGSHVLAMCVNGEKSQAFIIGGLDDPEGLADSGSEAGHHLEWEFNGINITINDDGELTLTYKGKTKADGTPDDGVTVSHTGAAITLAKNGDVSVGHKDHFVKIDHANNKIEIFGKDEVVINASVVTLGSGSDAVIKGETYRTAEQNFHQALSSNLNLQIPVLITQIAALSPIVAPALTGAQVAAALTPILVMLQNLLVQLNTFEAKNSTFLSNTTSTG